MGHGFGFWLGLGPGPEEEAVKLSSFSSAISVMERGAAATSDRRLLLLQSTIKLVKPKKILFFFLFPFLLRVLLGLL